MPDFEPEDAGVRGLLSRRFVWVAIAVLLALGIFLAWLSLASAVG